LVAVLSTPLSTLLEIDVPIIAAPMIGAAGTALARAVSSAGALGMIGISPVADLTQLGADIDALREEGVRFGVGLLGWSLERRTDLLDFALSCGAALVSVSFGEYAPAIRAAHDANVPLAVQAGTLGEAADAVDAGVDIVVARGGEGGGHGLNAVATLPLLQSVLDRVDGGVPVVAAGGIGGPRGLAAVLAAGAAGAWVGTALLACEEAANSDDAKARVIAAEETSTVYTTAFDRALGLPWPEGVGGRALRNAFTDRWAAREAEIDPASDAGAEMRAAWARDDLDVAPLYAGQVVGTVGRRRPAGEVITEMADGAERLLRRWSGGPGR
jgi:nitronate monooxygenase